MPYTFKQGGVKIADGANLDPFSRLRVSTPVTLFDQAMEFGVAQLFWNTTTSGAASAITHQPNISNVLMTCGTEANAYVYRQTYEYSHYRPGKGHQVIVTGTFGAAAAGVRRRMGYFDSADGIFLEQNGTTDVAFTIRTYASGSPAETERITQANWNVDTLDGTHSTSNPSGVLLDLSKGQILVIDLQWLGYGRVRMGFDLDGQIIYCHEFLHANSVTQPYMRTASLPIRFEIANTSIQVSTHTLLQGCSSVVVEDGAEDEKGLYFSANNGITAITVTTRRAILSIRPKATIGPSAKINRVPISLEEIALLTKTNDCFWELVYNPTFTGTPVWTDPGQQQAVEYSVHGDAANGAITGGLVIHSGYNSSQQGTFASSLNEAVLNKLPITLDMNGANPIAISLVVTSMTGNSVNTGALCWKEVR